MTRLADIDLTVHLRKKEARRRFRAAQQRLIRLRLRLGGQFGDPLGPPLLVLFEGWDASGKGGAITRLVAPLDPRHVRVAQFAAPTADEKRHHFLWRFAPALPGWGGMAVLDRSWYGRVLVERVEGFATEAEWQRAYDEIAAFEAGLAAEGAIVIKFWLHISREEQLRRFQSRAADELRRWKLTDDDWRNRDKWDQYAAAVDEMLQRTDRPAAPWTVIPAEHKPTARALVLEHVCDRIERDLAARIEPRTAAERGPRTAGSEAMRCPGTSA